MSGTSQVIKIQEVMQKSSLGRSTVFARSKLGTFPRQIKLGQRASGWIASEIDEWISQRTAERDAGKAA